MPGMASSLSSVPPVWPSPLPDILAILMPGQQAMSGAKIKVVVSPTPPVECLSALTPRMADKSIRSPDSAMAMVSSTVSSGDMPWIQMAISMAES